MRAGLVQVLRDDLADRVLPDLVGPDAAGMLLPFVPVRPGPEHEVPEVQPRRPLATCVSFALGHWRSSGSMRQPCDRWSVAWPWRQGTILATASLVREL